MPSPATEPALHARGSHLRVEFQDPGIRWADFHYLWLRHFCPCCRHPATGERTLCASTLPADVRPSGVAIQDEDLVLEWKEAGGIHVSRYPLDWLRENAYAPEREDVTGAAVDLELRFDSLGDGFARICVERVYSDGAVVVRGAGNDTEALIDAFEAEALHVIPTHFGRVEDLRTDNTTNENIDQLGYTNAVVDLHTDQPFLERPPRFQMLHCMRPAARGGDNAIADGFHAARLLRSLDASAFALLSTVPVRFDRQQKQFQSLQVRPIIELRHGEPHQVRASYFTYGPHRIAFDTLEAWYRAYARFAALLEEQASRFRLESGDFLFYDNHRMLHARTGFEGARWVRGVYFDPAKGTGGNGETLPE